MTFFNALPCEIEYGDRVYRLTPAYDNILNMYEETKGLELLDKLDVMAYYLMEEPVLDVGLIMAIMELIVGKAPKSKAAQPHFSFSQDAPYIYAAFRQTYGINLLEERGKLHWWEFNALLQGLGEDTRFVQIVQIRRKPLPKPTKDNREEIARLIQLKREYALEFSEEERQEHLQADLRKMFNAMMSMAKKEGERHE